MFNARALVIVGLVLLGLSMNRSLYPLDHKTAPKPPKGGGDGPRGIRNNNPGNIRKTTDPWQGLSEVQSDPSFFVFTAPEWGIRAMAIILANYQRRGVRTLADMIATWAPGHENPTEGYIAFVARRVGISADTVVNLRRDAREMIAAMIEFENGQQPYSDEVIDAGLSLAGV